jgi:ABC-type molybdenum transport system ATPase subunit/photorepair protein PhrA
MDILNQVADKLAQEVLEVERETGDEGIVDEVKKTIGASSTTLEEAYMTAVRVRRAEARARALIEDIRRVGRQKG